jgi:hypothetical protein
MHEFGAVHETPSKKLPFVPTFGLATIDQPLAFRVSTRVCATPLSSVP